MAWTLRTVAAILANPRYTGRQVWKRQGIEHHETRPGDKRSRPAGSKPTRHWNPQDRWEVFLPGAHPALVGDTDFVRAQRITAVAAPEDGTVGRYQLTGLVICWLCGRRTDGHWAHRRAYYRCRHGRTSASDAQPGQPPTLYLRQDHLADLVRIKLGRLTGADLNHLNAAQLATGLCSRGIMIVCSAAGITLDSGLVDTDPDDTVRQLEIPGSTARRRW